MSGVFRRQYGRRLRIAREAAGITQTELGRALGLSRFSIANIEAGRQSASAEACVVSAAILDVDPCWLLVGTT